MKGYLLSSLEGGGIEKSKLTKYKYFIIFIFTILLSLIIELSVSAKMIGISDFNSVPYGYAFIDNVTNTNATITIHNNTNFYSFTGADGLPSIATRNVASATATYTNPYSIKFTNVGRDCETGEYLDLVVNCNWVQVIDTQNYRTFTIMDFWNNPTTGKNEFGLCAYGGLVWQKMQCYIYYHNTSNLYTKKVQFAVEDIDVPAPTSYPSWSETIVFRNGFTDEYYVDSINTTSSKYIEVGDYYGGKKYSALKSAGDCEPENRIVTYVEGGSFNFEWWSCGAGTDFFISQYGLLNNMEKPIKKTTTEIVNPGEVVSFDISQKFPFIDRNNIPSNISLTDILDDSIDTTNIKLKVYKKDGTDISSLWNTSITGQTISFSAKNPSQILGLDIKFHIEANLKTGFNFNSYSKEDGYIQVPNKATIKIGNKTFQTNEIKVKVPYYKITTEVENGVIDANINNIIPDSTKTINYHENDGYMIKSITIDGKEVELTNHFNSYTFTNINASHHIKVIYEEIPTTNLTIAKNWDDTNNNDGYRPSSITMNFIKNDIIEERLTLNASNEWRATKTDLRLYTPRRELIVYDWSENMDFTNVDKYTQTSKTTENGITTITNYHKLDEIESKITKVWDDTNNNDGFRPSEIQMSLYKDDVFIKTITLNESNNWQYIEKNLLKYKPIKQLVNYTWREEDFTNSNKYTLSNTQVEGYNTTITNTHELEKVDSKITKEWNDTNNHDGFRPSEIQMQLYKNDEIIKTITLNQANNWQYTEKNLLKYNPIGKVNIYYWREVKDFSNHDKYTISSTVQNGYNTSITNTHELEKVDSKITKVWDDTDNHDGYRPSEIQMSLFKNNEVFKTVTLNESNNWQYIEKNLLKYEPNGQLVNYTWKEEDFTNSDKYILSNTQVKGYNTTITNTHTLEKIESKVTKIWNDTNNHDGFRPSEIHMQLYKNDEVIKTITLTEADNWQYIEKDLLKYSPVGKANTYYWREVEDFSNHDKYIISSIVQEDYNTIITNTHELEKVESKITKIWDDTNNHDKFRPSEIQMELYKNGVFIKTVNLNKDSNWKYTESNLLKYEPKGKLITYSWKEKQDFTNSDKYKINDTQVEGYNTNITNYHKLEEVESKITLYWDDENNNDGYRPDEVKVILYKNDEEFKQVTINKTQNWEYTEEHLLKYNSLGEENTYYWREIEDYSNHEKYEIIKTEQKGLNTEITNYHELERVNSTITKVWDDGNNNDNYRPSTIYAKLYQDKTLIKDKIILNDGNKYKHTEYNLLKYHNQGIPYQYKWDEDTTYKHADKYKTNKVQKNYNTTITNTHELEKVEVHVKKVWEDNNNHDKLRPSSIQINLLGNGQIVKTVTLSENSKWETTITNLNKFEKGKVVNYTFEEPVLYYDYESTVETNGYETVITNTRDLTKTSRTIKKEWNDNNNQDQMRPSSVQVELLANGEVINDKIILNEENNWKEKIANLNYKDKNGEIIQYEFREQNIPEGYEASYDTNGKETIITNTYTSEKTKATVMKEWNDENNKDGIRPNTVEMRLYANGERTNYKVTLNERNSWTDGIANLPKYKNGKIIHYEFKEESSIKGYENTTKQDGNLTTITNTHIPETVNLEVVKEWNDEDNIYGIRPNSIQVNLLANDTIIQTIALTEVNNWKTTINNLPKYENGKEIIYSWEEIEIPSGYTVSYKEEGNKTVITNSFDVSVHAPNDNGITISVKKEWDDNNNVDKLRPDEIEVLLLANHRKIVKRVVLNEVNNWSATVEGLNNADGLIEYTWEENGLPVGYSNEISTKNNKTIITNIHIPNTTSITIKKEWNDNNNVDGLRPTIIKIGLLANGKKVQDVELTEADNWEKVITDLPLNNEGKEIEYTVKELTYVKGYTSEIETNGALITITNTHRSETIELKVTKEWNDNNNSNKVRPDEVTVNLLANETLVKEIILNSENNWTQTISNLPKNKEGKEIVYQFVEQTEVKGYTTTYKKVGFETKIINTYNPENVTLEVQKVWIDNNNQDKVRPSEVTVILMRDGKPTDTKLTLKEDNDWYEKIESQPKYENGKEINYNFVLENEIDRYDTSYNQENYKTIITSIYNPENVTLEVQKVWIDNNNQDKVRPSEVTVILMKNGKTTDIKLTLNESNNWYEKIESQPKYENGKEITYNFVLESEIDKYKTDYSQDGYKTIITSQYESEQIQPEVQIIWDDLENQYQKRPDKVIVRLYINGEPSDIVITLTKEDNWYKQLEAMPKYKDGKEIEYKFIEEVPNSYKESYEYEGIKTIITNYLRETITETPSDKKELTNKESLVKIENESIPKGLKEEKVDQVKTSDNSIIILYLIISICGFIAIYIKHKKR